MIATFLWLGLVTGTPFLEAPLKFRASGITIALGLRIGRLVFRALNRCEAVIAVILILARTFGRTCTVVVILAGVLAALTFAVRILVLRPALDPWAQVIIDGDDRPSSDTSSTSLWKSAKWLCFSVPGSSLLRWRPDERPAW